MPYAIMPEPKVKYFRLIFHRKIDSKTNTWYDALVSLVSFKSFLVECLTSELV